MIILTMGSCYQLFVNKRHPPIFEFFYKTFAKIKTPTTHSSKGYTRRIPLAFSSIE